MNTADDDLSRSRIRLALVAAVRLYRDGLAATLSRFPHLIVTGTAGKRADAVELIERTHPDMGVIDVALDDARGLFSDVQAQMPATRLLAFGINEDISAIIDCAEVGAAGYVTVDASIEDLVAAIERTVAGELMCSPRVTAALFRRISDPSDPSLRAGKDALTVREGQVLALLPRGLTNKEIGSALKISEATVKNHVHHLLEKLNVGSRAQAVARAQVDVGRDRCSPASKHVRRQA